jgi:hypothetical protein
MMNPPRRQHCPCCVFAILLIAHGPLIPAHATTPDGTPFVNEIHYDNEGSDLGEAIEIAGPAGTELTGWQLDFYNGGTGTVYRTVPLAGSLEDLCGGFGVLAFPVSGLQNGAPDGYALVDSGGTVQEFLSYEGSFEALDGPAAGMTSVDMGVSESTSTPTGHSLQRIGVGVSGSDFSWSEPRPASFGACNKDQTFAADTPRGLIAGVFYEDADGDGTRDSGEPGIPSVVVQLTGDEGSLLSDTTAGDGLYAFSNLSAGVYRMDVVVSTLPPNVRPTDDPDGVDTPGRAVVNLETGGAVYDADFGYRIGDSCAALSLPTWDGTVVGDGDARYLPLNFGAGVLDVTFYDVHNLRVDGLFVHEAGLLVPAAGFSSSADSLSYEYLGEPSSAPESVYPRVAARGAGPSSFFLRLTDQCGRTVDVDPVVSLGWAGLPVLDEPKIAVFPNPSSGEVSIRVAAESGGTLTVDVFDVLGRRVRRMTSDHISPGSVSTVVWDGRSAAGVPLGTALYLIRASVGSDVATGQVSLLR